MRSYKTQQFLAIIGGVVFALAIVAVSLPMILKIVSKHTIQSELSYYDQELLPYIRTNLDTLSNHNIGYEIVMDAPSQEVTSFGQHLNKHQDIVLLGKTAKDFKSADTDILMLNKMIRKLYINSSYDKVLDINRTELKEKYYHQDVHEDYIITSLYIDGLDTLQDRNSSKIANELRFSILGFVKVYLGLINLNEVTVEDATESTDTLYSFNLILPTGEEYLFKYALTSSDNAISDIMVERR